MLRVGLGRITPINARTGGPTGGGTPSFLLDFADAGAGVVNVAPSAPLGVSATFTRATGASTVLSNGLIGTVASGSPRSYYDPTSLVYLGYLAEGARTNLLLQSEVFDDAAWTKVDTVITANNTISPDGTQNADLCTEGTAGTARITQSVTATADVAYSVSRFFKRGNTDWVMYEIGNGANFFRAWLNLATGALGSTANGGTGVAGTAVVKAYPNGWYRFTAVGTVGSGATAIAVNTINTSADAVTTRVNNATRFEWGAQFENNVSFASSYIATVGTTVTRNADVLVYPLTGWYVAGTGTIYGQGTAIVTLSTTGVLVAIDDNTLGNRINLARQSSNQVDAFINAATVTQSNLNIGTWTAAGKAVMAFATNDVAASFNAGAVVADVTATIPTVTQLSVGHVTSLFQPFSPISRIAYFPTRLANAQLVAMTA